MSALFLPRPPPRRGGRAPAVDAAGRWPAAARTSLELDARQQPVALLDWGDARIDRSGTLRPEEVWSGAANWQPTAPDAVYKLGRGEVLWFRFVVPPAPDAERWYLRVLYPGVNRATLYRDDHAGGWASQSAGDMLPVAEWPLPHRFPLLPLAVSAEVPRNYLLRVENAPNFSAPLDFVSEGFVIRREQRASLVLGMYFGLAALVCLLGIVGAAAARSRVFAAGAVGGADGAHAGIADRHGGPAPVAELAPGGTTWRRRCCRWSGRPRRSGSPPRSSRCAPARGGCTC
ncbi:hypothetical protein HK414_21205 [Ramlibacter terrae]|uniref:7TM-DISM receptor extracellular domain-containing protein n=1 Tax=Ramlibacter terrae TaxID=2732511 RepID=A0ABX6P6I7_9BURK|nr:hypothetical protein HK414_21205 [Ramlibacter terrae]